MGKVAILTDSNSGITLAEAKDLGIYVMPMPFYIDEKLYYEEIDLSQDQFYEKLREPNCKITTSMPIVGDLIDKWEELLESYDEVVYIPMSSGLSSSCATAIALSDDYDGRVQVVNNQRVSVTQRLSVMEAIKLSQMGKSAEEIKNFLDETKFDSSIYITVGTLDYLKKGGRLTPAVAAIGTLLRIKPVLQIQGEKLDSFAKARTMKQAKQIMMDQIAKDMKERYNDPTGENTIISIAHTQESEAAEEFRQELLERFPGHDIIINPLSLSISCHIGPGSLAVTASVRHEFMK
ncbi:MAG TPA: DegV family protein [Lachnospiraceae bacterium]|jgi:DegV family protein with EDD domain|nr:DegV family protein [Lachnospiraceae bacterium]MDY5705031.1 DegV family protein [Lachnospiraceae bacterium]HAN50710.1 DegV family protein [Lachnospiraceae bacterium]